VEPLPLIWVDLEMTGLDPALERIVEVAVVITDGDLQVVAEGPDLVLACDEPVLAAMHPRVREMHAASGLLERIAASTVTLADAEAQVLSFVRAHVPEPGTAPLAGSSVHTDRAFLHRYMPAFEAHCHYRNVDVSTVKELARRWHPDALASAPGKLGGHRALADILESIEELRHYRTTIFR
jgi:oligoribonuclease